MNGTTRCPLCDTRFRITEAQLNAHNGMVRCGHCHGAFDARIDFIAEHTPEPAAQPADEPVEDAHLPPDAAAPVSGMQRDEKQDDSLSDFIVQNTDAEHLISPPAAPELTAEAQARTAAPEAQPSAPESQSAETKEPAHVPEAAEQSGFEPKVELTPEIDTDIRHIVSLDDEKPLETPAIESVSAQRTWPWLLGISVCVLLLAVQSAYFLRVELAAHLPALRPALTGICNALGCKVALPRDMDAISIESSGLDADPEHDNLITLNALLRNRAGTPQTYPMLVLTLNDNRDKLLARRPLAPAEYLPAGESEATGFAPNHEISVRLRLDTVDLKPSGYRLELFYGRS